MTAQLSSADILDALIARSGDVIWASELAFFEGGNSRIDFWTLEPVGGKTGYRAQAYEIKVDRADFRRDSEEKQRDALKWSDRFWYVAPPDVIPIDELPPWAGLQTWDGAAFRVLRKAPKRAKAPPSWPLIISILRNSGECRRDVGFILAQNAFLQKAAERDRRQQRIASKLAMDKWMRRLANPHAGEGR